jgi:hypothetical protein
MPLFFAFALAVAVALLLALGRAHPFSVGERYKCAFSMFHREGYHAATLPIQYKIAAWKHHIPKELHMENQTENTWLASRLSYLKALKSRSDQQELLVILAEKIDRTPKDEKNLAALVKAEKANVRAAKARQEATTLINADRKAAADAERKARDHEMYQAAGLLSLAGLVDKKTGKPVMDRGELLGALLGLAKLPADNPKRAEWKRAGDALLAEKPEG